MTTMLLASGKRRIIYFGSMSDVRDEQRYLGYCRAMENAGLAVGRIAPNKVSSVSIGTGMMTLARQMYADMDGILCTNDDGGGRVTGVRHPVSACPRSWLSRAFMAWRSARSSLPGWPAS